MKTPDTAARLAFVMEMDRLKGVLRQSLLYDGSRRENSAEHSWQLALAVMVCAELSNEPLDVPKAVKMALVHDVVEIDSGDVFIYDYAGKPAAAAEKYARESKAADRLFGLLPKELGDDLRELWEAYERMDTPEARFVYALDRLLPLIANVQNHGHAWKKYEIGLDRVMKHNRKIEDGSQALWNYAEQLLNEAVEQGLLS